MALSSLISCRQIGDTFYMIADVSYECYTNEFNFYKLNLVIPLLFAWIGFITGLILLKLY